MDTNALIDAAQAMVINCAARIAEIQALRVASNDFDRGYIAACKEIAAQIRKINKGGVR
jgi:hypothetical protein